MAVPVARVHLKMAHAALPALLPTPPKWKILPTPPPPTTTTPPPCLGSVLRKPGRADTGERWDAHKPGRADAVERWDAHKKKAGSSSVSSSFASSRATSADRWDVHKKRHQPQAEALDDGESSRTGSSNDDVGMDMEEEEEEILWKPRAMYAGPGFVVAAPKSSMLPMPTSFLVTA